MPVWHIARVRELGDEAHTKNWNTYTCKNIACAFALGWKSVSGSECDKWKVIIQLQRFIAPYLHNRSSGKVHSEIFQASNNCWLLKELISSLVLGLIAGAGLVVVSQFNGTSTPKGSYSAKTGDNGCNVNSSRYSLSTALCGIRSVAVRPYHNQVSKMLNARSLSRSPCCRTAAYIASTLLPFLNVNMANRCLAMPINQELLHAAQRLTVTPCRSGVF